MFKKDRTEGGPRARCGMKLYLDKKLYRIIFSNQDMDQMY